MLEVRPPTCFFLFLEVWNRKIDMKSEVEFIQIPREKNRETDMLANEILDQEKLGI